MGKNCYICKRKLGFMNGKGWTKEKLLETDKIPFHNMTDDDYMCGRCYTGDSFQELQKQHKLGKLVETNKEKHSIIPKKIDTTDEPVLPKDTELKSKEESNSSNSNSTSSEDITKTISPIGKRDISKNTSRPDMSRLMVASNLLPENYELPLDEDYVIEFEYGNNGNFKSTKVWMNIPVLAEGEEILWSYVKEQGVFNKSVEFVMAVTNFRAGIWHFEELENTGFMMINGNVEPIVMNSHRVSNSHRMGSFHSTGRMGMRIGTHGSIGSSNSKTVGDVHLMTDGETIIRFGEVSDPHGIVKLVKSIQKQITLRSKIDESNKIEGLEDVDNRTILEILELYNEGEIDKCLKLFDTILQKTPNERVFEMKAAMLSDAGKWKELVVESRNMLSRIDSEKAFEKLMVGLVKLEKTNDAIDELHRGLELYPENTVLLDLKKQLDDFEANNLLDNKTCPKCNKENESDSKFCNKCGAKFDEGCKECGKVNPKNSKFCNDCGASLV